MRRATSHQCPREILVVEDDPTIARDYCEKIGERGYSVACAYSTDEALSIARRRPPAFALLDIRLNGQENGGILVAVKLSRWYHAPHAYVTAFGSEVETRAAAEATNPVGILDKLAQEPIILETIEEGIREQERRDASLPESLDRWIKDFEHLQASEPTHACELLVNELENRSLDDEWIEDLVLLAEDTQFSPEQEKRLAPRLLEAATVLRDNESAAYTTTVWSAIRTYASMIVPEDINSMAELLTQPGDHAVDTLLVTLKSLRRLLEVRPPATGTADSILMDKVVGVARAYLDPWVIRPGEDAAIGQNTILVLTALGNSDVLDITNKLKSRRVEWFQTQLSRRLREMLQQWPAETRCGEHNLVSFAEQVLRHLES